MCYNKSLILMLADSIYSISRGVERSLRGQHPSGRIRLGVGRSWILVKLWVGQISDALHAASKKNNKKRYHNYLGWLVLSVSASYKRLYF